MILGLIFGYIFVVFGLFSYFFSDYYLSELFLSFLPYHIVLVFFVLVVGCLALKNIFKKKKILISSLLGILLFGASVLFAVFLRKFTVFYNFNVENIHSEMTGGIKILYANIYKNNTEYSTLKHTLEQEQPDLIFFVEFTDEHYKNLKDILDIYPYTNKTIRSKAYAGNMVFSKIKIDNWAEDFPQGAWRYGYFSVMVEREPIYFYLVHMSSPINTLAFRMRNTQIKTFFEDFDVHKEIHRDRKDKVIVLGDFNTSPWSAFYWEFADGFNREFINITRSFPILFTWNFAEGNIFWSHIDHIFTNQLVSVKNLTLLDIAGSDHKGFSFEVK